MTSVAVRRKIGELWGIGKRMITKEYERDGDHQQAQSLVDHQRSYCSCQCKGFSSDAGWLDSLHLIAMFCALSKPWIYGKGLASLGMEWHLFEHLRGQGDCVVYVCSLNCAPTNVHKCSDASVNAGIFTISLYIPLQSKAYNYIGKKSLGPSRSQKRKKTISN